MTLNEELQKLQQLHQSGVLSDEEYARAKASLLNNPSLSPTGGGAGKDTTDLRTRQWALFLHLSQFSGYLIPLAGLLVPIVIWQLKKVEMPGIDVHGKIIVNWIISEIIYAAIGVILTFVIIGIPLLIALGIIGIIFPIVGGIKANNGEAWKYPLSISFLK
jgi:uncharacterized protein